MHPRSDFGGGPPGIPSFAAGPTDTGRPTRTTTTTGGIDLFFPSTITRTAKVAKGQFPTCGQLREG